MAVDGLTILLIDDNDDLREVTVELLEAMGHRVVDAGRGQAAVQIFEERADEIDLVVSEFVLPAMDGLELAERLRSRKPSLGVLVTSTHDNHRDLRARVERGEVAFLRKPYSAEDLEARIEQALTTRSPATTPGDVGDAGDEVAPSREAAPPFSLSAPSEPAGPRSGEPARGRGAGRVRSWQRSWLRSDLGLSVAAGLVIFGVVAALYFVGQRPPALPDRVPDSVTRAVAVQPISPVGEVETMPAELRWRPVKDARQYRARLFAVDEATLWQGETDRPRLALPEELRARLHTRVLYYWVIEAFDAQGSRLAGSEWVRFIVTGPPAGEEKPVAAS